MADSFPFIKRSPNLVMDARLTLGVLASISVGMMSNQAVAQLSGAEQVSS
jgi:hypothetical protein